MLSQPPQLTPKHNSTVGAFLHEGTRKQAWPDSQHRARLTEPLLGIAVSTARGTASQRENKPLWALGASSKTVGWRGGGDTRRNAQAQRWAILDLNTDFPTSQL